MKNLLNLINPKIVHTYEMEDFELLDLTEEEQFIRKEKKKERKFPISKNDDIYLPEHSHKEHANYSYM